MKPSPSEIKVRNLSESTIHAMQVSHICTRVSDLGPIEPPLHANLSRDQGVDPQSAVIARTIRPFPKAPSSSAYLPLLVFSFGPISA